MKPGFAIYHENSIPPYLTDVAEIKRISMKIFHVSYYLPDILELLAVIYPKSSRSSGRVRGGGEKQASWVAIFLRLIFTGSGGAEEYGPSAPLGNRNRIVESLLVL